MKNRWLTALCAVGLHISIGSIYAWSQIAVSIKNQLNPYSPFRFKELI